MGRKTHSRAVRTVSKSLRIYGSSNGSSNTASKGKTLTQKGMREYRAFEKSALRERVAAMDIGVRIAYEAEKYLPEDVMGGKVPTMGLKDIPDSRVPLHPSHAGGEFAQMVEEAVQKNSRKNQEEP